MYLHVAQLPLLFLGKKNIATNWTEFLIEGWIFYLNIELRLKVRIKINSKEK